MNKTLLAATAALAWTGAVLAQTALPTLASPTPTAPPLEAPPLAGAPSVGLPPPAAEVVTSPAPPTSVVPVTALARVLSVTAAAQPVIGNRVVCTETAEVAAPTTGAGAVAGAIVGATVGHQIGGGAGNALATAAGAVGGALVGDQVEQGGRTQMVRRCVTQSGPGVAYQVVYEYAGQQYSATLPYHPGATLPVQITPVAPVSGVSNVIMGAPAPVLVSPAAWAVAPAALAVGVYPGWGRPYRGWRGHRHWRY